MSNHVNDLPELGVRATVVMDQDTHAPTTLDDERRGLRTVTVLPGESEEFFVDGDFVPADSQQPDMVCAYDTASQSEPLVDEVAIVSGYSLHVALFALQQLADDGDVAGQIASRALEMIGVSGDVDEHVDPDSLRPLPVPEPSGWRR